MDAGVTQLMSQLRLNSPPPSGLIEKVQLELGITFPADYANFIAAHNGGEGPIGNSSYLSIWPLEEMGILNEGYETQLYAPGLVFFGGDGGGEGYGWDTRDVDMPIVQVPYIGMEWGVAIPCGTTFVEFLEYVARQR